MKLQLIRNATLKLDYAGRTVLIDPYFAPKHSQPSFAGRSPNPLVELPVSIDKILDGVELVIVSHLHEDHFDEVAMEHVPKHMPIICQPGDEAEIRGDMATWEGLTLTRREGSHGLGPVLEEMGSVMGFSLEAAGEPSIYWAGDTVLYPPVTDVIRATSPDILITHSCGALWNGDLIVMNAEETIAVCEIAASSLVIATHMEALDHATIGREGLRRAAEARGIPASRLLIPADGEVLVLTRSATH
ncbi:MBL fold metallo-hydrolase [Rhizobium leguminosarum]|uniref:MBL fold metallo-hydrolase n=1 Tax=Rhizobium leguminosarum TaxID=384 RepID=UPI002FF18AB6